MLFEGSVDITGEAIFSQNAADETGGAVAFAAAGHLTISENATVTFMENTCEGSGGGIAMWGSDGLYIEGKAVGVSFVGNTAGDAGGAIYLTTMGSVNLYGASFAENQATNLGGAVRIFDTESLSIGDLDFSSNTARIGGALVAELYMWAPGRWTSGGPRSSATQQVMSKNTHPRFCLFRGGVVGARASSRNEWASRQKATRVCMLWR